MSQYSSFKSHQLITENWRKFLKESIGPREANGMMTYGGGDLKNFPIEVQEYRFPLRIHEYRLRPNSGGEPSTMNEALPTPDALDPKSEKEAQVSAALDEAVQAALESAGNPVSGAMTD